MGRMRPMVDARRLRMMLVALALLGAVATPGAHAAAGSVSTRLAPGTQPSDYIPPPAFGSSKQIERLHFRYGPLLVRAGTNMIMLGDNVPKPAVDGYIVGIRPNLTLPDGTVPSVNVIHLHHGVWLNFSAKDATYPVLPQRFFASGEEKTWAQLPQGFGYPFRTSDQWMMDYMLHNLTPLPMTVYITYEIDFVPATPRSRRA